LDGPSQGHLGQGHSRPSKAQPAQTQRSLSRTTLGAYGCRSFRTHGIKKLPTRSGPKLDVVVPPQPLKPSPWRPMPAV
jgi:hypothetical protein